MKIRGKAVRVCAEPNHVDQGRAGYAEAFQHRRIQHSSVCKGLEDQRDDRAGRDVNR